MLYVDIVIQLYTYEEEVILDPFMGSGQTAIAAIKTRRHFIGYEINKDYVKLAEKRIKDFYFSHNTLNLFEFQKGNE